MYAGACPDVPTPYRMEGSLLAPSCELLTKNARSSGYQRRCWQKSAGVSGIGLGERSLSEIVSKIRLAAGCFEQKLAVALVAFEEHLEPR
jgi:hypothetical protein